VVTKSALICLLLISIEVASGFGAQVAGGLAALDAAAPPPLPSPAALTHYTAESPWLAMVVAVALTGVAVFVLVKRQRKRAAGVIVGVGAAAAAGLFLLSQYMQTPRERMMATTQSFIQAVATAQADVVRAQLTSDAALVLPHFTAPERIERIMMRVRSELSPGGVYEVKAYRILNLQAHLDGPARGRAQVKITVTPMSAGFSVPSWWRIDYEQDASGEWKVSGIALLSIGGGIR